MKKCIITLLLLIANLVSAQQKQEKSALAVNYEKAKNSMSYLSYQKAFDLIIEKMDPDPDSEIKERFDNTDGWLGWIKDNLDKTAFKNYEEAEQYMAKYIETGKKFYEENAAYFDAWAKATEEEQLKYILGPS
ncbi:hypothetical protein AM493_10895 [Flavobacterium akiainvivens]|uniref:Uncharacterized protein n=1 Tax=Flavobacterium akiainvivens TaxID=1202724 RepID=A0A0M8MB96_9FLAO|nr:hypothetical protein [Flavobacterium akiainvivens]KOS06485.1 hypothetical protein AM493_10895 [Flavobacterium akiainvivens]SFQ12391.1 hypothetical protein SAMN05444144_101181 [Flavobacterium akiainvivens]